MCSTSWKRTFLEGSFLSSISAEATGTRDSKSQNKKGSSRDCVGASRESPAGRRWCLEVAGECAWGSGGGSHWPVERQPWPCQRAPLVAAPRHFPPKTSTFCRTKALSPFLCGQRKRTLDPNWPWRLGVGTARRAAVDHGGGFLEAERA